MRTGRALVLSSLLAASLLAACAETRRKEQEQHQPNEPSPNASILPAPLASALESPPKDFPGDAGPEAGIDAGPLAPVVMRSDQPMRSDSFAREAPGLRLVAEAKWLNLPAFPRLPELNTDAVQRLRDALTFAWVVELSPVGRLRVVFDSPAFALPRGSELRARDDYYGHVLVWNAGVSYAVMTPGTLRALLSEHRADAAPLTKPRITEVGRGHVLGVATVKRELSTPLGRLVLEQGSVPGAGSGASLLCRLLVELIAADPGNAACLRRELPLRAELFSSAGGHWVFEAKRLERDVDIEPLALLTPPAEAGFVHGELPASASTVLLSLERLRELRVRPVPRSEKADPTAPKQGLLIQNRTESLRFVLLDGVILARVLPRHELHVDGLLPGKYALASLDFLGDDPTPVRVVELPARFALGEAVEAER